MDHRDTEKKNRAWTTETQEKRRTLDHRGTEAQRRARTLGKQKNEMKKQNKKALLFLAFLPSSVLSSLCLCASVVRFHYVFTKERVFFHYDVSVCCRIQCALRIQSLPAPSPPAEVETFFIGSHITKITATFVQVWPVSSITVTSVAW